MTLDRVREIISEFTGIDINEIASDTILEDDLAMDSLEYYNVISELSKELDAPLDMVSASRISTVGELYEFIKNRV